VHRHRYLHDAPFRRITPKFCTYPYTRRFEHRPTCTRTCSSEYDSTIPICHSRQSTTWYDLTYAAMGEPRARRFHTLRQIWPQIQMNLIIHCYSDHLGIPFSVIFNGSRPGTSKYNYDSIVVACWLRGQRKFDGLSHNSSVFILHNETSRK
jgi:hypothetical protein